VNDEHPNATAYRRTAHAFRSGDEAQLAALIADDVGLARAGLPFHGGGDPGRDALEAWLGQLRAKGFWLGEHDVLGNDVHVCALSVMGARRAGVDVQTRVVSVFHYRDGRQIERWTHPEDLVAWEQIFAD
jgi:ketosteroid isomerase-like protein